MCWLELIYLEGLDVPEVSLVAILDADKEGFLRSTRALIQTVGRAARNENGRVIMYADNMTDSMQTTIDETERRREIQQAFNEEHNITPKTIKKAVPDLISIAKVDNEDGEGLTEEKIKNLSQAERREMIETMEFEMKQAAKNLEFEKAAQLRDVVMEIKAL